MVNNKGSNNRKVNVRKNSVSSKVLTPNNILLGIILLLIVGCIVYIVVMTVNQNKKLNQLDQNIKDKNAKHLKLTNSYSHE